MDTFTGWIEAFPVSKETKDVMTQVMELMSEALNISWKMGLIKLQLTKLSIEFRFSWPLPQGHPTFPYGPEPF